MPATPSAMNVINSTDSTDQIDFLHLVTNGVLKGWIDPNGFLGGNLLTVGPAGPAGSSALPVFGSYTFSVAAGTTSAMNNTTGVMDYSGSDAAAVIRSVIGNMPNGGRVLFKNGIYNLNSLILETTGSFTHHYAIGIPGGGPNTYASWQFVGESFNPVIDEFGDSTVQTNGVVLNLTTTAENSITANSVIFAMWARPDVTNGVGATISMRNITVRLPSNQRGNETAINFTQALMIDYDHVVADFDVDWNDILFPVAGSSGLFGISTSGSVKEENYMKNVFAMGYDVGLDIQSEHTVLINTYAINCNHGIDYGVHGSTLIYHTSSWVCSGWGECARGLTLGANCQAGSLLDISGLDIEDATVSIFPDFVPVYHVKETTAGHSFGRISYSMVTAGVGIGTLVNLFDGGGGSNFQTVNPNCTVLQPRISKPRVFSGLPAASSANEGSLVFITDSTTNTWGATITGGGGDHVLAYSNGTNWTVAGA